MALDHNQFGQSFESVPQHTKPKSISRLPAVLSRTGTSRAMLYYLIGRNEFPQPIKLGARAVGWLDCEIDEWIDARIEASRTTTNC